MNIIYQLYRLNEDDGYFDLCASSKVGFQKLTTKLKTAPAQRQSYKDYGISEIIHSKKSKKNDKGNYVKLYHNGLIPSHRPNVFCGDHYEIKRRIKIKSFVVFEFSHCGTKLLVHFIEKYKVFPSQRRNIIDAVVTRRSRSQFLEWTKGINKGLEDVPRPTL